MSKKNILVVDDEQHIVELIKFNLENNGYNVFESNNGEDALKKVKEDDIDLVLLDLMLPEIDGLEVCQKIKRDRDINEVSIIMVTAKGDETDKIIGLEIGADDYITKPFSIRELLARVKAVLRRSEEKRKEVVEVDKIYIGDIIINLSTHEVYKKNEKLDLTLKEFELLYILSKNRGKVLSRNYLLDEIWGYDYFGETRTVDVHIRHLRKKVEDDDKNPKYVETVRGVGYKIK